VVGEIADRLAVMYAGRIVETGATDAVFSAPAMPYTEGLMASIARVDQKGQDLTVIKGLPPALVDPPPGCSFHPRCAFARDRCTTDEPPLYEVPGNRLSACHYWEEVLES